MPKRTGPGMKSEDDERAWQERSRGKQREYMDSGKESRKRPNQFDNVDKDTAQKRLKSNPDDGRMRIDFNDKFGEPDEDEEIIDHISKNIGR